MLQTWVNSQATVKLKKKDVLFLKRVIFSVLSIRR